MSQRVERQGTDMLGDLLRQYRQRLGLSQEELAERVIPVLSVATISNIERGRTRPYRNTLIALCVALALTPEEQVAALELWRAGAAAGDLPPPASLATDQLASQLLVAPASPPLTGTLTVLIADLRDYTAFTHQHGDVAGAALTARFATLAAAAIEAEEGRLVSVHGDEVLAVFTSAHRALRAAVDLVARCAAEATPLLPLRVGVGLDVGEPLATPEGDYRGEVLNVASRLCAQAGPGEILASETVVSLARRVEGLAYGEQRALALKGLAEPVRAWVVRSAGHLPPATGFGAPPSGAVMSPAGVGVLPFALTPLVGREYEEAAVVALLQRPQVRLVTLTGPGGVGKTRLAQQAVATLAGAFAHGTVTISLAALREPELFLATVAQALGVRESGGQPLREQLIVRLRDQALLLLLDNFEQVTAAAPLVTDLLGACAGLKALVTSRVRLRVRGEHEFVVPPLALPDPSGPLDPATLLLAPAVALFVQRAQAYRLAFTVDASNAMAVATICRRLDGLPLALELASARLKLFSPQALLARLGDQLALLTGGAQDTPQRHQTLRATLAWSYDLLAPAEQVLFRRLSVFAGGCTLEAAEAVCADPAGAASLGEVSILDGLTNLVDQHLLRAEEGPDGEPRFAMLETIHAYSREQLAKSAEAEALARRHAAYFVGLAERAEPELRGPEQQTWLGRLDRDHDNLRAVLEWSGKAGDAAGVQLAGALWRFWWMRRYLSEGRRWLEAVVTIDAAPAALRARALHGASVLARAQGDAARAQATIEECLALRRALGDPSGIASALNSLGNVAVMQRDFTRARLLYEESLALGRALGDQQGIEDALENLGTVAGLQGDFARARALIEESLSLTRASGNQQGMLFSLHNLGWLASEQGDFQRAAVVLDECLHLARALGVPMALHGILNTLGTLALRQEDHQRAEKLLEEGLTLSRAVGDRRSIVSALNSLGCVKIELGDTQRAQGLLEEALTLAREVADQRGIVDALEGIALLVNGRGSPAVGARLLGFVEAVRAAAELPRVPGESAQYAQLLAALHLALDAEAFAAAWADGRALSIEDVVTLALASSQ